MSRTYRKKHNYNDSQLKSEFGRMCNASPSFYERWKMSLGTLTPDQLNERNVHWAKNWVKTVTTDNGSKGWKPWSKSLKQTNAHKSRAHARNELSKVYRDWGYDVENIKYNKYDNRWNWD